MVAGGCTVLIIGWYSVFSLFGKVSWSTRLPSVETCLPCLEGESRLQVNHYQISIVSWRQNNFLGFVFLTRFHAAVPVSGNRILVCGGCSAIGALQDVHIVNIGESVAQTAWMSPVVKNKIFLSSDTNTWSSVSSHPLCSRPCAGHSVMLLSSAPQYTETSEQRENVSVCCSLLVFGGSDCCGTFYNDTVKCTVEIPAEWRHHWGEKGIQTGLLGSFRLAIKVVIGFVFTPYKYAGFCNSLNLHLHHYFHRQLRFDLHDKSKFSYFTHYALLSTHWFEYE